MAKTVVARGPRYARPVRPPLARLFDALAGRRRGAVDILCVGDSITEGTGASARTTRWLDRLQDQLRAAFPVPGVAGGAGYIPAMTMADYPSGWSYGGNITANGTFGLGRRSVVLKGSDGYAERSVYGTSITVTWTSAPGLGTFDVLVDGTVAATVDTATASGSPTRGGNRRSVTFARGTHVVRLRWKSGGDCYVGGLFVRDGDESRGVRLIDSGQHGSSSADWSRLVNPGTAYLLGDEVAAIAPAAVVLGLGPNDMIQGLSPASHKANLLDIIALIRANATIGLDGRPIPILLHAAYQLAADYAYPWASYVQNMREIAYADATVQLLDFSVRLPRANANPDGMIAADGVHLNDVGDGYYAGQFRELIVPPDLTRFDYAPRQRTIRQVSGPYTAKPDEVIEVNAANGSIDIAPWADLRVGESVTILKVDSNTSTSVRFVAPMFNDTDAVITTPGIGAEFTWTGTRFLLTATNIVSAVGPKGDTGAAGAAGAKGETGAQGIQGVKGDKGDKGDTGTAGAAGAKGDTGSQGIQGVKGDKGDKGDTGTAGTAGAQGAQGPQGPQGEVGVGVPAGGAANTYLIKRSATDYDDAWVTRIYAQLRATASLTCSAANTVYPVPMAGEDFDDESCHDLTTNNSRWVAPRAMTVKVSAIATWVGGQSTTNPQRILRVQRNGVIVLGMVNIGSYVATGLTQVLPPTLVSVTAGQYLEMAVSSAAAGAQLYSTTGDYASIMTIEQVR